MASYNPSDFVEGENLQVTVYDKSGNAKQVQSGTRYSDIDNFAGKSELQRHLDSKEWSLNKPTSTASNNLTNSYNYQKGMETAKAIYYYFPEAVMKEFAKAWVKFGDAETAAAATRQTGAWKDEFGYLQRKDGTLIMTELDSLNTKASFRETLGEVGISDTSMFEEKFNEMIKGEVFANEFQDRVDLVYEGVKNQIPEVEKLFRERYGIETDGGTIFAALIDPDIEDKLLKGELKTLQLQAEASSRGFSTTFNRFNDLRKRGFTQEMAGQVYEMGEPLIKQAAGIGRQLGIETLEEAALGDALSKNRLQRIQSELQSTQGVTLGAARKDKQITGLISD